jgi:hypothetical protein
MLFIGLFLLLQPSEVNHLKTKTCILNIRLYRRTEHYKAGISVYAFLNKL